MRSSDCTTESNYWTHAQASKVHDLYIQFMRPWIRGQRYQITLQHSAAMQNFTKVLPSLHHIEYGLSTHCEQKLEEIEHSFFVDEGINIPQDVRPPGREQNTDVAQMILNNMTESINSLRLCVVSFHDTIRAAMIPSHLQHLDLELLTRGWTPCYRRSVDRPQQPRGCLLLSRIEKLGIGRLHSTKSWTTRDC